MKLLRLSVTLLLGFFAAFSLFAQQNTLELESTFKGNQEQPKVLYIVPWQNIEAPPASYRPLQSLVQQNFRYLDRDEFKRQLSMRRSVSPKVSGEKNKF